MTGLSLKIITPTKSVFEEDGIDSVTLPSVDGELTILPNHIPLVCKVVHGEITVRKSGKDQSLVTTEGFLKLNKKGEMLLLADYAVRSEEIEIEKVRLAKEKAEKAMKEKVSEKDFAIAEAELRRTLLELKISQKRRVRQPKI